MRIKALLFALALASLSCSLLAPVTPGATQPVVEPLSTDTATAPLLGLAPAGVLLRPNTGETSGTVRFLNADGAALGELLAPYADEMHYAGRITGALDSSLVFHSMGPSGSRSLNLNSGQAPSNRAAGVVTSLVALTPDQYLAGLVGAPGTSTIFYIIFAPSGDLLRSTFIVGDLNAVTSAAPVLTMDSNESRYWKPVAIQTASGAPESVWFTRTPWGIGGDIIYWYYEGLSSLNLATGEVTQILPPDAQFNSTSPDQAWLAYATSTDGRPALSIRASHGGEPILLPARPEMDRGAGDAVFSPSDRYVAWREAQGSLFEGALRQVIRVATLDGNVVAEFNDTAFIQAAGLGTEGREMRPVAWLDDDNLLVQVFAYDQTPAGMLVRLNLPTSGVSLFAPGVFGGLLY